MSTKLDKEQVALRQLDTAIELMFRGGDIVSVHTLASAAIPLLVIVCRLSWFGAANSH